MILVVPSDFRILNNELLLSIPSLSATMSLTIKAVEVIITRLNLLSSIMILVRREAYENTALFLVSSLIDVCRMRVQNNR